MAYLGGFYLNNPHVSQFDGSTYAKENCTPATGANGINSVTRGLRHPSGATVRSKVSRSQEVNPATPGWHLDDLELALSRFKPEIPFQNRTGRGWDAVLEAWDEDLYVVLQGDSDRFPNGTCSGKFDGLHCIGSPPIVRITNGHRERWIDDPICPTGRFERESVLKSYAQKLSSDIFFGAFLTPVSRQPLWGSDVPSDIRAVDPPALKTDRAVRRAAKVAGVKSDAPYGTVINMLDLEKACSRAGIDYKTAVNPIDLRTLLKWAGY